MPEQLVFDLSHRPALGVDDFLVSASNQAAVAVVDAWPDWPNAAVLICGPSGVGKSHLVNVWRSRSDCLQISGADLNDDYAPDLGSHNAFAVEDVDRGIASERALFHLLNLAREQEASLLLTTRIAPGVLSVALPDLRSRLRALPVTLIEPPDDSLLRGMLVKLFIDRQLRVDPATISYILTHMERSAESASAIVREIDHHALQSHRRVTRILAREVIYKLFSINH